MLTSFQSFQKNPEKEKAASHVEPSYDKKLEELVDKLYEEIFKINSLKNIQSAIDPKEFHKEIKNTIVEKIEDANKKVEETYKNFVEGKYDNFLSSDTPSQNILKELKIVVEKYPKDFVEKLFLLCKSQENLKFWVENGANLPKNPVFLAVDLGNNLVVLNYLKDNGYFANISNDAKINLLERAERFKGEGLNFLKENVVCDLSAKWQLK